MSVPLEQFVKQLEDSGLITGDTLKDFVPPKASPGNAEELAVELVRKKKLTKFQVVEISKGKGKSLVLGNYVLLEKIGAGGMGQVFKARHSRMDRLVAVKLLPQATSKDKLTIARFDREVKAAAKITHPNIVAALDADCANGIHFLVMELVEGSDLSALVKINGPFSIEKTVNYILQAAKGLEAAHKKGIIHRDIKPANLLLNAEGIVKVLDMGLARLSLDGDEVQTTDLTSTGTVMGTVDYMPPEQALDTKTADERADIYALGCSMYYLLTAMPTYQGDTIMKKLLAHREQPIPSLTATSREIPEQLDSIFKKLVAKKVEDRYQTMTEVVEVLDKFRSETTKQPVIELLDDTIVDVASRNSTIDIEPAITTEKFGSDRGKISYRILGVGFFGIIILAGVVFSLITKHGKLIVEIDQPDAEVQVLNDNGKIQITERGVMGKVEISVDPGKHRLVVEKDGFKIYGKEFEMKLRDTQTIKAKLEPLDVEPVAAITSKKLAFEQPGFDDWVNVVTKLPAEKQIDAVSKKLRELNPGFDGTVIPILKEGVVTELQFITDDVTDLSPVKALKGMFRLHCEGTAEPGVGYKGRLVDITPLRGMSSLTILNIAANKVFDLSPLEGMQLQLLVVAGTKVSDVSPLRGMPLKMLITSESLVTDLSPLKGMLLSELICDHSKIVSLAALVGMPLKQLCCQDTNISDLSPVKDMPLEDLRLSPNKITHGLDTVRKMKSLTTIGIGFAENERWLRDEFWNKYDAGEFGTKTTRQPLAFEQAGFDDWAKSVAAKSPEKQVEAVSKKLQELNHDFDGKVTPTFESGVVTGLQFSTDNVTDISPVRALVGLKSLSCNGSSVNWDDLFWTSGKLTDLSPLSKQSLTFLNIAYNRVADLSPLAGIPLTQLICHNTNVADLSPLLKMQLEHLRIEWTPVHDLSPLNGMPLKSLSIDYTRVADLSPLKSTALQNLQMNRTPVTDLSPLKKLPLETCDFRFTPVTDFLPLRDMPLKRVLLDFASFPDTQLLRSMNTLESINDAPVADFCNAVEAYRVEGKRSLAFEAAGFDQWIKQTAALSAEDQVKEVSNKLRQLNPQFDGTVTPTIENGVVTKLQFLTDNVTDISPVRALSGLGALSVHGSAIGKGRLINIAPLNGLPLTAFTCYFDQISDLSPLQGMKLTELNCNNTLTGDLSALKGMPINYIDFGGTRVNDLTPLIEMPLARILCGNSLVWDISPLTGMKLTEFSCWSALIADSSPLRDMLLKTVWLGFMLERDTALLRSLTNLETINGKPVAEFWKEIEEREEKKKQ